MKISFDEVILRDYQLSDVEDEVPLYVIRAYQLAHTILSYKP